MSTLGSIFVLLGLVGLIWGIVRLIRQRKHPLTKRLNLIIDGATNLQSRSAHGIAWSMVCPHDHHALQGSQSY